MNILYISYDGATDNLGQSQILPYILGLSKKYNIEFSLLTFEKKARLGNSVLLGSTKEQLYNNNVEWAFLRYHKSPSLIVTIYDLFHGVLKGSSLMRNKQVDIIHGRTFIGSFIALLLKKIHKVKVILDIRGFWPEERVEAGLWKKNGLIYKISKLVEKALILDADEIIVLTLPAKKELENSGYFENKQININVIPTCVNVDNRAVQRADDEIVNNLKSANRPVIAYIGSLSTWYMPLEMFDFFAVVKRMIPDSFFLILTKEEGFLKNILRERIEKQNDIAVRNVEHKFVPYYLSAAQIGLAFYKPGYSRKACSPTKIGEYLAQGLPVIINSGIGDCDEIILKEKVGVVINEYSAKEYERGVHELLNLLSAGDIVRQRCKEAAKRYFSLEMGIDRYFSVYSRLMNT